MASKALNQLLWEADWGALDYMIIDLPPGTGDIHLSLIQSIPLTGAVVISTPQPIAISDARKGINMFRMDSINVPVLGLLKICLILFHLIMMEIRNIFLERMVLRI